MLAKMGWTEGESLGAKSEEGITEPVSTGFNNVVVTFFFHLGIHF